MLALYFGSDLRDKGPGSPLFLGEGLLFLLVLSMTAVFLYVADE